MSNYLLLELYKLFDTGPDCISIDKVKNFAFQNFDSIFPPYHDYSTIPKREFSELSRDDLFTSVKCLCKKLKEPVLKIERIRNKGGLAHGMYPSFDGNIDFHDVEISLDYIVKIINIFTERYSNTWVDFYGYIKETATLKDLSKEYALLLESQSNS